MSIINRYHNLLCETFNNITICYFKENPLTRTECEETVRISAFTFQKLWSLKAWDNIPHKNIKLATQRILLQWFFLNHAISIVIWLMLVFLFEIWKFRNTCLKLSRHLKCKIYCLPHQKCFCLKISEWPINYDIQSFNFNQDIYHVRRCIYCV